MENSLTNKMSSFHDEEISIVRLEQQNVELIKLVEEKKIEAKELSEQLLDVKWKIKRTEFASYCERRECEEERQKIQKLDEEIKLADQKWSGAEVQLEDFKKELDVLRKEKSEVDNILEQLHEQDRKNESIILELSRDVKVLQNRNAAIMLKLKRQKREFEDDIENYPAEVDD